MYGMHRADLLDALAAKLPAEAVRLNHRCVGIVQTASSARLHFAHGDNIEADIIIAADGIHSTSQKYVVEPGPPEYSGFRAYRSIISARNCRVGRRQPIWFGWGTESPVVVYRFSRRALLLNYVGFVPTKNETIKSWSAAGDRDELAASFDGWDSQMNQFLETVEACFWWGLYDRRPLASWTSGRLVLLGDAAHAMLPHLGQGANQAIEDGVALAVLLEGASLERSPGCFAAI